MTIDRSPSGPRAAATPAIDPLTAEVLRSALVAAAEEASIVVVRAAHSAFVVEGSDASAAILDADGRLIAQSMATTLLHSASLRCTLPSVLEVFPLEAMQPGDVYCTNDVYRGGIHANDILVFTPIFAGGVVRWFAGTLIHILDLGGSAAAGVSALATDVFQEGLQLPPVRMATAGVLDAQLLSILAANSRLPDATIGDLRALIAGATVAARRMDALIAEHGVERLAAGIEVLLARSEQLMRADLARFPDGVYRAGYDLDGDGIHERTYHVAVAITIDGDRAVLDFTGTDDQVAASINAGESQSISGALFGLRCFLDPTIPMNEGCFAPVEFVLPRGSLLHATPPFPGGGRFLAVFAAIEAIFQALSEAEPDRAIAASGLLQPYALDGVTTDGRRWIHTAYDLGGMGARLGADGLDAVGVHHGGGRNAVPQSEPVESRFPFVVERVELIADSGGRGRWRGGMGTRTVFLLLDAARLTMRCDRLTNPPRGARGGDAGRPGGYFRVTPDGSWTRLPDKSSGEVFQAGDRFVLETSGGGGMGDPAERDPALVARDLAEGRISRW
jgi:N-methylhydantoinase B